VLSIWGALFWLSVVTVLISLLSDAIMSCITAASAQLKVPMPFLTTIGGLTGGGLDWGV